MQKRILIAYASKTGSTAEVAEKIGQILRDSGAEVDVRSLKNVSDVKNYDGIIIGSAIRMFKLLPETIKFSKRFSRSLENIPVAYFIVCLAMKNENEENRQLAEGYLKPLYEIKQPIMTGLFAGKIDYSKLPFLLGKILQSGKMKIEEGDFRNWELITEWAKKVAEAFNIG
jgi:menaquinone-dependent protoporphyrinogen oxidase